MNTQMGNSGPFMGQPQQPGSGTPMQAPPSWGATSRQPYGPVPPQSYAGTPAGGAARPPQPPYYDADEEKKKKTIRWIVLVAILDVLLFLLWLLLPTRCNRPHDDSESSIEASDISELIDTDTGELQFAIEWKSNERADIDAHCVEPNGNEISWEDGHQRSRSSQGYLNFDRREFHREHMEHIKWVKTGTMPDGDYLFYVQNYNGGSNSGVKALLKTKDGTYSYQINNINDFRQDVPVVTVTIRNGEVANIQNHIQPS